MTGSLPSHNPTRRWRHPYLASYEGRPVRCFGPNDCVVHNFGIGPKTFQTKSLHQTSVWIRLSSSCRVRRTTKYSQTTKQSLIRAWFGDFVDFLLDSFGVHVELNRPCISLWCFVYAWPKIWVCRAYFCVESFGRRRFLRLRASSVLLTNLGLLNSIYY